MHKLMLVSTSIGAQMAKADVLLPILARFVFAATLLQYFWVSGLTKLGDGPLGFVFPSFGAYAQIFPKTMEAISYDISQLGLFHWGVVVAGTWAEFILPLLIVVGALTRLSAIGMIGFIIVQSLTDLYGHGAIDHGALGAWFDKAADSLILDQRTYWVFVLIVLVIKGAGALSFDHLFLRRLFKSTQNA